jgi:hypothetical protein
MTETERNFLLDELASKTKLLIQMKLDRRAGKYVSHARMERITAQINTLRDTLYPHINWENARKRMKRGMGDAQGNGKPESNRKES